MLIRRNKKDKVGGRKTANENGVLSILNQELHVSLLPHWQEVLTGGAEEVLQLHPYGSYSPITEV